MSKKNEGAWVDLASGKVVRSEPEMGKLLVPPGVEPSPRVRAILDGDVEAAVAAPVETATAAVPAKKAAAKKAAGKG